jgi:hypothetical protein
LLDCLLCCSHQIISCTLHSIASSLKKAHPLKNFLKAIFCLKTNLFQVNFPALATQQWSLALTKHSTIHV